MNSFSSNLSRPSSRRFGRAWTAALLACGMAVGSGAVALAPSEADASVAAESRFNVAVSQPAAEVGKKTTVSIKLTANDPWHMNVDFPTSLKMSAAGGVTLAKDNLKKGDAKTLSEHEIVFELDVTPTKAGKQTVSGKLKFAICKAESCSPVSEDVSVTLDVKGAPAAKRKKK